MKMEHEVKAQADGQVHELFFAPGEAVNQGEVLMVTRPVAAPAAARAQAPARASQPAAAAASVGIRPDLQRVIDRHALTLDAARPQAVARRRERGQRTARENVTDLCDAGSLSNTAPWPARSAAAAAKTTCSATHRRTAW
jgi:pyruvate/2-oxoglutarate dehydrogenase complex dihydrolipoamide acyltransferase (E2) component